MPFNAAIAGILDLAASRSRAPTHRPSFEECRLFCSLRAWAFRSRGLRGSAAFCGTTGNSARMRSTVQCKGGPGTASAPHGSQLGAPKTAWKRLRGSGCRPACHGSWSGASAAGVLGFRGVGVLRDRVFRTVHGVRRRFCPPLVGRLFSTPPRGISLRSAPGPEKKPENIRCTASKSVSCILHRVSHLPSRVFFLRILRTRSVPL